MNDCQNAVIRDQLPDLLHDRLDASSRSAVQSHVASCTDCRRELELLRGVHGILLARTPHVDTAWVVGALPRAPQRAARPLPHWRAWSDWRIAAAVAVLAVGGGSMAVLHRTSATPSTTPVVAGAPQTPAGGIGAGRSITPSAAAVPVSTVATGGESGSGLTMTGRLEDLSDDQLQALLDQVGNLQALPVTEPDPVAIQVESTNGVSPEGL